MNLHKDLCMEAAFNIEKVEHTRERKGKRTNIPLNYRKWYASTLRHTFGTLLPLLFKN